MIEKEFNPQWVTEYRKLVPKGIDPEVTDVVANKLRDAIIESNLYLCKRVVGKMKKSMPAHVERDDLESWAKIGLLQAVKRFDASFKVPFAAFATQRMRSVIMDGIRDADWAPRSLRKKQRDIVKLEENYRQEHDGQYPTIEQIARIIVESKVDAYFETDEDFEAEIVCTAEEISRIKYHSEISHHTYIEGNVEAQNKPSTLNPEEDELVDILKATTGRALKDLSLRKAAILTLHYYQEMKLADIATQLRMSEVKVGLLHQEAVLEIWGKIKSVLADA